MPRLWHDDDELLALMRRELFPAVVGDVMDKLGLRRQYMPPRIKPLHPDMVVAGRAMPVLEADAPGERLEGTANPVMARPFGLMFDALDDLKPNEVYVCTGASPRYALWGELMSLRATKLGAAGAVLDGYARDSAGILRLGFPTFAYGGFGQDQGARGKVVDYRLPVEIGGVRVQPGDMIFGDVDGVCVIPRAAEEEALTRALEKAHGENRVRRAIEDGMSARDAFDKFGIM